MICNFLHLGHLRNQIIKRHQRLPDRSAIKAVTFTTTPSESLFRSHLISRSTALLGSDSIDPIYLMECRIIALLSTSPWVAHYTPPQEKNCQSCPINPTSFCLNEAEVNCQNYSITDVSVTNEALCGNRPASERRAVSWRHSRLSERSLFSQQSDGLPSTERSPFSGSRHFIKLLHSTGLHVGRQCFHSRR